MSSERDAMKARLDQMTKQKEGGGGGDDTVDKLIEGKNHRRILPRVGHDMFFLEVHWHYRLGPNEKNIRCITPTKLFTEKGMPLAGTPCPACQKLLHEIARVNAKYPKRSEASKKAWQEVVKAFKPKPRYLINTFDPKVGEVKTLWTGPEILKGLLEEYFDTENCGDFTDPDAGRIMIIKRTGTDRNTEYKVTRTEGKSPIDGWDEIKDQLPDLKVAAGDKPTAEQIEAILKGVEMEEGEPEGEPESAPEEEEAKPRRPACFGSEDDYDPKDETCTGCKHFKACGTEAKGVPASDAGSGSTKARLRIKAGSK